MGKHRKPQRNQPEPDGEATTANKTVKHTSEKTKSKIRPNNSEPKENRSKPLRKSVASSSCVIDPRPDWHATSLPSIPTPSSLQTLPPELLRSIHDHADSLLTSESVVYDKAHIQTSSDHRFMATVMQTGTWSDKVSALTLVIQESPLHTRKHFEQLLGLAGKRSRDNALAALAALKDMLAIGHVLPKDRKLRYFERYVEYRISLLSRWLDK